MYRSVLLGAVASLALMIGAAQAQTMEEALAQTYRTNPQLSADRARQRATDEGVPRALSNWRPTVTVSGSAGKGRDRLRQENAVGTTLSSDARRTPEVATLSVTQPLYRGGRTLAETSRAENLVLQGRAQLQSTEQSVLLDAATAYTNLLQDQAVLDLNINNEQVLQRQLDAARDRFQVGEITRTDVSQAEARLSRARADRIQSEGNLTSSRANYLRIVGEPPARLSPARVPAVIPANETDALNSAASDNPAVISSRYAERAARDDVDLVSGELLPTVSLQGTLSRQHESQTEGFERDVAEATGVLSVPLYQAGSVDARVREAKQTASQRRILVDDTVRRAKEDATRTWEALTTARARIQAFQAQIRANEIALEGVEQEARVGSRTVLDVLDAEQELLDAKVNLVRAQHDEIVSAYQLTASVGRLTAQSLKLPVEVYDPTLYYSKTRERWIGTSTDEPPAGR
jgi:TolC family type I secretion outer membrane protein